MTSIAWLVAMAAIPAQPNFTALQTVKPTATLQLFQGNFIVRKGLDKVVVPIKLDQTKPPLAVVFRKNKTFAVWDDRGLSIRVGKKLISYKLGEIAVSPRVFERDEIRANLELMHQGKRSKNADALSGAKRIGNDVYFLVRWDDRDGKPWLEALVKVSMEDKKPIWKLVGRFEGLSMARKPIDDKLMLHKGALAVITSKGDDWGESFYSSTLNAFGFKKVGRGLVEFLPQKSFGGYFIEKTSYGTHVAGSVNLETDERKESLETKGSLKLLDNQAPMLAVATVDGTPWLRNASTGAEIRLPSSSSVRRTVVGVVVWTPISKPANAVLYDPVAWTTQAVWKSSEAQR